MKLGIEVGLVHGHIVLQMNPAVPPPKGYSPQFSVRVYCGQMAEWIQMPLSTEVGLSPGHIVLDGEPVHPPPRGRGVDSPRP